MEHVRDCNAAHREIFRVLRREGAYIFNVPFDGSSDDHIRLVDTSTPTDVYLVPPQMHGDPLTGGILAYRVFGRRLVPDLEAIGFSVTFSLIQDPSRLIIDGDVFTAVRSR
jgi:hypothetical protein